MASLPRPQEPDPLKPAPRISDPERLRAVYRDLFEADRFANEDRATITDEFSGGLPWEPSELENNGQGQMMNLNWGEGEAQLRAHQSTFMSLTRSAEKIAKVYLKPDLKISYDNRVLYQTILADEFHILNVKHPYWGPKCFWRTWRLAREYSYFGVGFVYFANLKDWRFNTAGLNKVKLQRAADYDGPDSTEVAFIRREYTAAEFVEPLKNGDKAATRQGWNVGALKAAVTRIMERYGFRQDLETFIHEIKNNDLYYRSGRAETLPILHSFVQEFNGKYSWYILTEEAVNSPKVKNPDGSEVEPWLFKKEFAFSDASDCLIPFVMEVGTGEIHSVRGTGHRLFEIDVQRNRMTCMTLDNSIQSGAPSYQASSEDAMEDFNIFRIGGAEIIPPGFTYVQKNDTNLAPALEIGMRVLQDAQDKAAGVFVARQAGNGGGTSQDASVTRAVTDENIILNEADRMNWLSGMSMVYNAQWRRIVAAKADDPGGIMATDLVKRCVARGVPLHIIRDGVDFLEPSVGIFVPGTSTSMDEQLERIKNISGGLPSNARDQILRAATIAIVGSQNAESLDPSTPGGPNIEGQIAIVENPILTSGMVLPVTRNQDHLAHAIQHSVVLEPTSSNCIQLIQSGDVQNTGSAMQGYSALIQHFARHVKELAAMPTPPPEFQGLQDLLKAHQRTFSQLSRVANANAQRAQKQLQKQQQEQGANGHGGPTPDEQATLIRAQGEVAIKTQSAKVDDAIKLRKAGLQAEIKNTAGAQKLQASDLLTAQKLATEKAKEVKELAAASAAPANSSE